MVRSTNPLVNDGNRDSRITLLLGGDVMTGRGIDQVLPHPSKPELRESYVKNAIDYVALAERANEPIPRTIDYGYVWGAALDERQRIAPDVVIFNLETSITVSDDFWPQKPVHYRMHPQNIDVLTVAGVDCFVLANNQTVGLGYEGLRESLTTLHNVVLKTAGAGLDQREASQPAEIVLPDKGRVLVHACGTESSGIPKSWSASDEQPGVNLLSDLSTETASRITADIEQHRRPTDIVVLSIHWGRNWGYGIRRQESEFARNLIDAGAIDVVHGHSSHHPRALELYQGKPVIYGCGDFIDDYEGIRGHEQFRSDLLLMYAATLQLPSHRLIQLELIPFLVHRFRLERPNDDDREWLFAKLKAECDKYSTALTITAANRICAQETEDAQAKFTDHYP